jgi:hypothetical protein
MESLAFFTGLTGELLFAKIAGLTLLCSMHSKGRIGALFILTKIEKLFRKLFSVKSLKVFLGNHPAEATNF